MSATVANTLTPRATSSISRAILLPGPKTDLDVGRLTVVLSYDMNTFCFVNLQKIQL